MADREIVEELLYGYIGTHASEVTDLLIDKVHAELGMYTGVSMEDIEKALHKVYGKVEQPKGIIFKEL